MTMTPNPNNAAAAASNKATIVASNNATSNNAALEAHIAEYRPRLKSFIRSRTKSGDDADDVLQDVWLQFARTAEVTTNPIENVSGWLFRVARNTLVNRAARKREQALPDHFDAPGNDDVVSDYLRGVIRHQLDAALAELPHEQRAVFELTEFDGIPVRKISEVTGIPVATLNSRKHYAVRHLRSRLRALYNELIYD